MLLDPFILNTDRQIIMMDEHDSFDIFIFYVAIDISRSDLLRLIIVIHQSFVVFLNAKGSG
jgi:hypothetical protein